MRVEQIKPTLFYSHRRTLVAAAIIISHFNAARARDKTRLSPQFLGLPCFFFNACARHCTSAAIKASLNNDDDNSLGGAAVFMQKYSILRRRMHAVVFSFLCSEWMRVIFFFTANGVMFFFLIRCGVVLLKRIVGLLDAFLEVLALFKSLLAAWKKNKYLHGVSIGLQVSAKVLG